RQAPAATEMPVVTVQPAEAPAQPVAAPPREAARGAAVLRPASTRPPPIDVHIDSGIARVGGNRALYFRLLQHFRAKYAQIAQELTKVKSDPAGMPAPKPPAEEPSRLDRLAGLLESADIAAGQLAQSIAADIPDASHAARFRVILDSIQQFKFPEAAAILRQ